MFVLYIHTEYKCKLHHCIKPKYMLRNFRHKPSMEQKKQPFRFRIPWMSESSPRRPKKEPFRPPGIAITPPQSSQHKMKPPLKTIPKKLETDTNGGSSKTGQQIRRTKAEQKKPEGAETKMMFATSNPTGQDIKVNVSSTDPGTSNVSNSSMSHDQKPPSPNNAQKEIKQGISNYVDKLSTSRKLMDDEDPFRVVTLAGDNRGAVMNIGSDRKKERSIHIHRAYKKNPEVTIDDGEESSEEESDDPPKKDDEVGNVYVNSNTQSINNSFMFQSWVKERDPGVEFILPPKSEEGPVKCNEERGVEIRKRRETNVCRKEGLNKQHRIRRRCLRGLLAETSESDNPDKPRRHGCKFKCGNTELEEI